MPVLIKPPTSASSGRRARCRTMSRANRSCASAIWGHPALGADSSDVAMNSTRTPRIWDLRRRQAPAEQDLTRLLLECDQHGTLRHDGAILPCGPGVVLAHAHPGIDRQPTIRILFRDVVEHDLAMIAHDVVGNADSRHETTTPERGIGGGRDVDLPLELVPPPHTAVLLLFRLQ